MTRKPLILSLECLYPPNSVAATSGCQLHTVSNYKLLGEKEKKNVAALSRNTTVQVFPCRVCGSHRDVSAFCLLCLCTLLYVYTECVAGWFGADCQQQCECENGGQCDRQTGRCSCSAGWVGELCERGEAASLYLHNNPQTL